MTCSVVIDGGAPGSGCTGTQNFGAGSHSITVTGTDGAGNVTSVSRTYTVTADNTPPTTTIALNAAAPNGNNGWYTSNVHVTVSAADNPGGSGVAETRCVLDPVSAPASFDAIPAGCAYTGAGADVTTDGQHTIYAASKDNAGNKETPKSASINIDKTAPTITAGSCSGTLGNLVAGTQWYLSAVTCGFTSSDTVSGLADSTKASFSVNSGTSEGTAINVASGQVCDKAGNCATSINSGPFAIELTGPQIAFGAQSPAANGNGWNKTSVSFSYTVTNSPVSGIDSSKSTSSPVVISTEGGNLTASATVYTLAGNHTTATTPAVNIDETPPTISVSISPATPASTGWYNISTGRPTVHFTCNDALSGVASCTSDVLVPEGADQTISGNVADKAGNTASTSIMHINVDVTAPTINLVTPTNNASYILNQSVLASYSCMDTGSSGLATCSGTVANGAAINTGSVGSKNFSVSATDVAGNQATPSSVSYGVFYQSGGLCDGDAGHQILQPINADGTSVFKQGSTTPAKFRVCDASGTSIGTPGVVIQNGFVLYQTQKGTITTVDEVPDSTTPDTAFRWDPTGQQWIFNISTKYAPVNVANQTYYFRISLNDGTYIYFQYGLK